MNIDELKRYYSRLEGQHTLLKQTQKEKRIELESITEEIEHNTKARWVLTEVAKLTQERFKKRVESLVTMAIRSVFDRPFDFSLIFSRERNRFVCTPIITEGDNEYIPKDDMGGGIIDLISFAFRVVLWSLEQPRSRNIFILDEPMKFVGKGGLLMKAGQMIMEISHKLGFQVIMVTHEPELAAIADAAWLVEYKGGKSKITAITEPLPQKKKLIRRKK
jgi:DNA repair exonuclease SbcCD ATPase subunit